MTKVITVLLAYCSTIVILRDELHPFLNYKPIVNQMTKNLAQSNEIDPQLPREVIYKGDKVSGATEKVDPEGSTYVGVD